MRWLLSLGASAGVAVLLLWVFNAWPRTLAGWLVLLPCAVLLWFGCERVGEFVFQASWWSRLSAALRVFLAFSVLLLLLILMALTVKVMQSLAVTL
jgi:hypothetical protein